MEVGTLTALSAATTGQWLQAFKASQIVPWPYLGQFAISPHQCLDEESRATLCLRLCTFSLRKQTLTGQMKSY